MSMAARRRTTLAASTVGSNAARADSSGRRVTSPDASMHVRHAVGDKSTTNLSVPRSAHSAGSSQDASASSPIAAPQVLSQQLTEDAAGGHNQSNTDGRDGRASLGVRWSTVLGHQLHHIYCEEESFVSKDVLSSAETAHALSAELKLLLLYFSSRWCPICVDFDNTMIDVYEGFKSMPDSQIEIIWVSCDVTEKAYLEHLSELGGMYAVPWKLERLEGLAELFDVQGLPALLVFDAKTGKCLTCWGREDVVAAEDRKRKRARDKGWSKQATEDSLSDSPKAAARTPEGAATPENAQSMWNHLMGNDLAQDVLERWQSLLRPASGRSRSNGQWRLDQVM